MHVIPLSLYIHIPWCVKKCPYCDFNSHEAKSTIPEDEYIDALITDIQQQSNDIKQRELTSIFIGGGTPSLFSAASIHRLLSSLEDQLTFTNEIEITIEANPGTYDQKNFSEFRAAGINRISIGAQSFSDKKLHELGRIHDAQTATNAVYAAKDAGFENINIDIMYALPKQTMGEAIFDIEQAIALDPTHISYYQLTLEPNTRFYQHPPKLPSNDISWEMQLQGVSLLSSHGYQQYEISAYSKTNKECAHNLNYWQFGDYVGIGAGAHQKLTNKKSGAILRSEKPRHPQQYIRHIHANEKCESTLIAKQENIQFEFLLNALRLTHGFNRTQYELHTGLNFDALVSSTEHLQEEKLLLVQNDSVQCTHHGYRFLDEILQCLLPEPA